MRIKPLRDHILIEPLKEEKKKGGIILPETVEKERPEKGRVLAVGPGKIDKDGKRIPLDVKKGDIVLFAKYGPNEIEIFDDKKEGRIFRPKVTYLIAKEEDILAIIE